MYEKADIRVGIDSIRFKLSNNSLFKSNNILETIIKRLKDIFKDYDNIDDPRAVAHNVWIINNINKKSFCKVYQISNNECIIELYGMNQPHNDILFEISEEHKKIIDLISKLKHYDRKIVKLDTALDVFYDYDKTLVFYGKRTDNNNPNSLKEQNKNRISFLDRFPTHTLLIPIEKDKLIQAIRNNREFNKKVSRIKSYSRFVKEEQYPFTIFSNYNPCHKQQATHLEIRIKDRKLYYKTYSLIEKSGVKIGFNSEIDSDEDIRISKNRNSVSIIKYDKTYKDTLDESYENSYVEDYYNKIAELYSNNDDEFDSIKDELKHTRVEIRLYYGGNKALNINGNWYDVLYNDLLKQISKLQINIFNPISETKRYLLENSKINKNRDKQYPIKIKGFGKSLDTSTDDVKSSLDELNTYFTTDVNL